MSISSPAGERRDWLEFGDPASLPERPFVSVLMLTYNHSSCLAEAIEGVLMQETDFPIELLIGEDCSQDNTREIALDYQRRHPHLIRVITSNRNVGGQQNARRLFEASRGEYLALCDGDDYWVAKEKLSRQLAVFAARPEVAICFHPALLMDHASRRVVRTVSSYARARDFSLSEVILGGGGMMPTSSMVLRRTALCPMDDWLLSCPVGDYPIALWATSTGVCHVIPDAASVYRAGLAGSWSRADAHINTNWRNVAGVIAMLEEFPRKTGRSDIKPTVALAVRGRLRDFHMEFGTPAADALPGRAGLQSRLSLTDRLFVFACNYPTLRRVLSFVVAKARVLQFQLRG